MNELALFTGAGGGLLATQHLLGWRTICYVEKNPYCVEVIKARIKDKLLDDAPIWDDARTFDGHPWRRCVDIITGGFPCQPFALGGKQLGWKDSRNLFPDTIRIIREIKPRWVYLENSTNMLRAQNKGATPPYIQQIVGKLAVAGYVGQWGCLSAYALGADHKRQRLWIVAHASGQGRPLILHNNSIDIPTQNNGQATKTATLDTIFSRISRLEQRLGEPSVFRTPDGLAHRMDRLTAIGNGQVPAVAAKAWNMIVNPPQQE